MIAIAAAIAELQADRGRLTRLRAAGIDRARHHFDIRQHARLVEDFFREVLHFRS